MAVLGRARGVTGDAEAVAAPDPGEGVEAAVLTDGNNFRGSESFGEVFVGADVEAAKEMFLISC